jgi:pimeloyl-ACP methyl ester carboxylesterase
MWLAGLYRLVALCVVALCLGACEKSSRAPAASSAGVSSGDMEFSFGTAAPSTVIVFLHGVLGHPMQTFSADGKTSWPEMLANDPSLGPPVKVLSVGYMSSPLRTSSNVNEIATRVLLHLRNKHVFSDHHQVIFITHSMGGLIAKRMLVQLKADSPEEFAKVSGMFFMATPAGGSTLAQTAAWVSGNPQFDDMRPEDMNTLLQVFEDDWRSLLQARTHDLPYPKTFCAYETLPTKLFKIVPRSAAQINCDERPVAFDRDHLGIVKPSSTSDQVYVYVAARIKRIMHGDYLPLKISAQLRGRNGDVLPTHLTMKSGDQFAIHIESNKPAWYYVISHDGLGKIERVFPSQAIGSQASPETAIRVPKKDPKMLELDRHKGLESFYIFSSSKRNARLESIQLETASKTDPAVQAFRNFAIETRGIVAATKKNEAMGPSYTPSFDPAVFAAESMVTISVGHL